MCVCNVVCVCVNTIKCEMVRVSRHERNSTPDRLDATVRKLATRSFPFRLQQRVVLALLPGAQRQAFAF
jgi:hypothetical protein